MAEKLIFEESRVLAACYRRIDECVIELKKAAECGDFCLVEALSKHMAMLGRRAAVYVLQTVEVSNGIAEALPTTKPPT